MSSGQLAVWKGQVPISIELQSNDPPIYTKYFFLARRVSYFPLYDGCVSRHFNLPLCLSKCQIKQAGGKSTSLPWHLPIGVIYDMISTKPNSILKLTLRQENSENKFNSDAVDLSDVSMAFYARLKEADALSSGSFVPKIIPSIPQQQHEALFNTIVTDDFERHIDNVAILTLNHLPLRIWEDGAWRIEAFDPEASLFKAVSGNQGQVLIQGILIERDIPMKEVYKELGHPDGFLYLVII